MEKSRFLMWTFLFVAMSPTVLAQISEAELVEKTREIILFQTSQEQVEMLMKAPKIIKTIEIKSGVQVIYRFSNARLTVNYSGPRCSSGLKVEAGRVLRTSLLFHESVEITKLGLEMNQFRSYVEPDSGAWIYTDEVRGVTMDGDKNTIYAITFFPTDEAKKQFTCNK